MKAPLTPTLSPQGRGKKEKGRGKKEKGRGKKEEMKERKKKEGMKKFFLNYFLMIKYK